jgi:hypothetical protein
MKAESVAHKRPSAGQCSPAADVSRRAKASSAWRQARQWRCRSVAQGARNATKRQNSRGSDRGRRLGGAGPVLATVRVVCSGCASGRHHRRDVCRAGRSVEGSRQRASKSPRDGEPRLLELPAAVASPCGRAPVRPRTQRPARLVIFRQGADGPCVGRQSPPEPCWQEEQKSGIADAAAHSFRIHVAHAVAALAWPRLVELTQGPPGTQGRDRSPRDFWAANEAFLALTRAWYTTACNVKRIRQLEVQEEEIADG